MEILYRAKCSKPKSVNELFFCGICQKCLCSCNECTFKQTGSFFCPRCLKSQLMFETHENGDRCSKCCECPSCGCLLKESASQSATGIQSRYTCPNCRWGSNRINLVAKTKDELLKKLQEERKNREDNVLAKLVANYTSCPSPLASAERRDRDQLYKRVLDTKGLNMALLDVLDSFVSGYEPRTAAERKERLELFGKLLNDELEANPQEEDIVTMLVRKYISGILKDEDLKTSEITSSSAFSSRIQSSSSSKGVKDKILSKSDEELMDELKKNRIEKKESTNDRQVLMHLVAFILEREHPHFYRPYKRSLKVMEANDSTIENEWIPSRELQKTASIDGTMSVIQQMRLNRMGRYSIKSTLPISPMIHPRLINRCAECHSQGESAQVLSGMTNPTNPMFSKKLTRPWFKMKMVAYMQLPSGHITRVKELPDDDSVVVSVFLVNHTEFEMKLALSPHEPEAPLEVQTPAGFSLKPYDGTELSFGRYIDDEVYSSLLDKAGSSHQKCSFNEALFNIKILLNGDEIPDSVDLNLECEFGEQTLQVLMNLPLDDDSMPLPTVHKRPDGFSEYNSCNDDIFDKM